VKISRKDFALKSHPLSSLLTSYNKANSQNSNPCSLISCPLPYTKFDSRFDSSITKSSSASLITLMCFESCPIESCLEKKFFELAGLLSFDINLTLEFILCAAISMPPVVEIMPPLSPSLGGGLPLKQDVNPQMTATSKNRNTNCEP